MQKSRRNWPRPGRLDAVFLLFALAFLIAYFVSISPLVDWLGLIAIILGLIVFFRIARRAMKKAIWRLRNRLIAAYLFIAVVPVVLITTLLGFAGYAVIEQMSIYLVNRELDHRESTLLRQAEISAHVPMRDPETAVNRFRLTMRNDFPDAHLLVTGREELRYPESSQLTHPPAAWSAFEHSTGADHSSGLVIRDGKLCVWAHVVAAGNEVTVLSPLTPELLGGLVPGLGDATFRPIMGPARQSHVPPALNAFDFRVNGVYPVMAPRWDSPKTEQRLYLWVDTRLSSVMGIVFGQKLEWGEAVLDLLIGFAVLFFIVESASLVAGVQLSRSITGAVHELYEGTQHVKEGDFGYRVPVKGSDQLAELTSSFNTMTENLSRLIVVAKEKERLESELEIAREVQSNLFPEERAVGEESGTARLVPARTRGFGRLLRFHGAATDAWIRDRRRGGQRYLGRLADGDHSIDHAHPIEPGERQRTAAPFHCKTGGHVEPPALCYDFGGKVRYIFLRPFQRRDQRLDLYQRGSSAAAAATRKQCGTARPHGYGRRRFR